jgi:hypothetical protein
MELNASMVSDTARLHIWIFLFMGVNFLFLLDNAASISDSTCDVNKIIGNIK